GRRGEKRLKADGVSDLLLDACGLAGALAQVVKLGATHIAATLHFDRANRGAVGLEHALDAFTVGDLAHGERRVDAPIALGDDDAYVRLRTLAVALLHRDFHDDRIARPEVRNLLVADRFAFELLNDVAHDLTIRSRVRRALARAMLRQVFLQQFPLLRSQLRRFDQVRAAFPRAPQRLLEPPAPDRCMVAAGEHFRHRQTFVDFRPRVVRPIEQAVRKRVLLRRSLVSKHAWQKAYDRIDDDQRRQLAARQHVIADRDTLVDL